MYLVVKISAKGGRKKMLLNSIFANSDIHKLLTQLGADLHYIGYRYEYALLLIKEDEQCIHSVTK